MDRAEDQIAVFPSGLGPRVHVNSPTPMRQPGTSQFTRGAMACRFESIDSKRGLVNGVKTDQRRTLKVPTAQSASAAAAICGRTTTFRCSCRRPGFLCVTGVPFEVGVSVPHCNLGHPLLPTWLAESVPQ